jgi:hypothetical protein
MAILEALPLPDLLLEPLQPDNTKLPEPDIIIKIMNIENLFMTFQ